MKVDWDGEGTAYTESDVYTLDISGLTFEGKTMDAGYVVPANLGEEQDSTTNSKYATNYTATATKVGYQTYEVTVSADSLTAHKRAGMAEADATDAYWIGVGLPQIDFNDNSLFVSKDSGESWTHIGGNNVTLNNQPYSMTYTALTDAEQTKTLQYKVTADNEAGANADGEISAQYTVTFTATTLKPATTSAE